MTLESRINLIHQELIPKLIQYAVVLNYKKCIDVWLTKHSVALNRNHSQCTISIITLNDKKFYSPATHRFSHLIKVQNAVTRT